MGYNTLITLKNSQLEAISQDENFGMAIYATVLKMRRSQTAIDPEAEHTPASKQRFDEIRRWTEAAKERGIPVVFDYEIEASESHHSSYDCVHIVSNGKLMSFQGRELPASSFEALAQAITQHGYAPTFKPGKMKWEAEKNAPQSDHQFMHGYEDHVFDNATTSLIVLNDALHDIKEDKTLGMRLARDIRSIWKAEKQINDAVISGANPRHLHRPLTSIPAGNHANPIDVACFTPHDRSDIVLTGGNWGRSCRPYQTNEERIIEAQSSDSIKRVYENSKTSGLKRAKEALLMAGFHVLVPGRTRSESPLHWCRDGWLTPDDFKTENVSLEL